MRQTRPAFADVLAAAPCTAMVFVWSHLANGDPAYTLVQVSVNDLIMLVLFAPIVPRVDGKFMSAFVRARKPVQ